MPRPADSLPHWPRLLSRELAAAYCGVGMTVFDDLVARKRLPKAKRFPDVRRALWDRAGLDEAIDRLRDDAPAQPEGPADDDIDAQEAAWQAKHKARQEAARRRHSEGLPVRPRRQAAA